MDYSSRISCSGENAEAWMRKHFSFLVEEFGFSFAAAWHEEREPNVCDHTSARVIYLRGDRAFAIRYWQGRNGPELYFDVERGVDPTTLLAYGGGASIAATIYGKGIDFDFNATLPDFTRDLEYSLQRFAEVVRTHCMDVLLGEAWYDSDATVSNEMRKKSKAYKPPPWSVP